MDGSLACPLRKRKSILWGKAFRVIPTVTRKILGRPGCCPSRKGLLEGFRGCGTTLDAFRNIALRNLKDTGALRLSESPELGLSRREVEQYSFVKAILAQDPTYAARHGGIEVEASRAMAQKLQKAPRGLFVPMEALHGKRDLEVGTPSTGGYLRQTDHLGDGFIDLLRAQSLILKLNPTRMQSLRGDVSIPRKTASATASWIAESAPAIESQPAFGQLVLRPRTIGAMTDFSRKTLLQASPDVENLVRMDLAAILGNGLDRAIVNGSGVGAKPLGIMGTTGVASVSLGANGGVRPPQRKDTRPRAGFFLWAN